MAGMRKLIVVMGDNEGALASYLNDFWLPEVEINFVLKSPSRSLAHVLLDISRQELMPLIVTTYNSFAHSHSIERLIRRYEMDKTDPVLIAAPSTLTNAPLKIAAYIEGTQIQTILEQTNDQHVDHLMYLGEMIICGEPFWRVVADQQLPWLQNDFMHYVAAYINAGGIVKIAKTNWLLPVHVDSDLLTLNHYLLEQGGEAHILSEIPASVRIHPPVRIDSNVSIGQNAQIGPYVYLERGSKIGAGSRIQHAVVLQHAIVAPGAQVENAIID